MDYYIEIAPYLIEGLKVTLKVSIYVLFLSIPIGLILGSISSLNQKVITSVITIYTWVFRGSPLLLQLYFGMYGLPVFGIVMDRMSVAVLVFTLNYGAYFTEIFRGSILSVDIGQTEVSKTLGFNLVQTFFYIIIPQALKRSIQTVTNEIITLVKDTALVAAIALNDLLRNAKEIVSRDLRVESFLFVGVIYVLISLVIVSASKLLERKYSFYR